MRRIVQVRVARGLVVQGRVERGLVVQGPLKGSLAVHLAYQLRDGVNCSALLVRELVQTLTSFATSVILRSRRIRPARCVRCRTLSANDIVAMLSEVDSV